jgi:hypothetical protein
MTVQGRCSSKLNPTPKQLLRRELALLDWTVDEILDDQWARGFAMDQVVEELDDWLGVHLHPSVITMYFTMLDEAMAQDLKR